LGVTTLNMLRERGVDIARVVVHTTRRIGWLALPRLPGSRFVVQAERKLVTAAEIAPGHRPDRDRA